MQGRKWIKNLKQMVSADPNAETLGSYNSIDSGISVKKGVKYCDFVGFHAKY